MKQKTYSIGLLVTLNQLFKWVRYSGAAIIISVNPLYWKVLPWFRKESSNEWGRIPHAYAVSFLFLTIRVWLDNGDW